MRNYSNLYIEPSASESTNIEPARVALIIQHCNAFTKPVHVNPNLASPIGSFPGSAARAT